MVYNNYILKANKGINQMKYIVEVHPEGANQGCFFDVVDGLEEIRKFVISTNVKAGTVKIWNKKATINPFEPDKIISLN